MSDVLEKIENNIDKNFVKNFDVSVVEQMRFLPIMKKGDVVFVAIDSQSNKENILNTPSLKSYSVKFIQLSNYEAFKEKLSPKQASNPFLWAWLTHIQYWKYALKHSLE